MMGFKNLAENMLNLNTLFDLHCRWSSEAPSNIRSKSGTSQDNKKSGPVITVEGRGRGIAVVQMKTTFHTTDNNILQSFIDGKGPGNGVDSRASLEPAFNLEPRVELRGAHNGTPATQLWVLSCQK